MNKPTNSKRIPTSMIFAAAFLLGCAPLAQADTLYWDASPGTPDGASQGGAGAWDAATGNWDDGSFYRIWTNANADTAVFGGTAGTVTIGEAITADGINFSTAEYLLQLANNQTLTVNNIYASGSGTSYIRGVTTDNTTQIVDNGGSLLTIQTATSADRFSFAQIGSSNAKSISLTGSGGTTISGPGYVNMRLVANNTTGQVTIDGGGTVLINNGTTVAANTGSSFGSGNIKINNGILEGYYQGTLINNLGTGNNELQILGGVSGFSGNNTWSVKLNNGTGIVQWGSTNFNPSTLVLQAPTAGNYALTFQNGLDLNGAQRTVTVSSGASGGASAVITGQITNSAGTAGGITKTGDGLLIINRANTGSTDNGTWNNYDGPTTVNEGVLQIGTSWNNTWTGESLPAASNLEISNAIVAAWYYLTRDLGTNSGEIQITGGRAGFSNLQGDATGNPFILFSSVETNVTWGSSTFNPSTLVLNDFGASSVLRTFNPFDLNGANRTVEVNNTGVGGGSRGSYATMEGDLSGAGASLTKTGPGTLMLNAANTNTYDSGSTINGGALWFRSLTSMPASGAVTVNDGAILGVSVGGGGQWTTGTSGNGTIGGLLAGLGGQSGGTVSYVGNVNLGLYCTNNQTYAGNIGDVGTSLGLYVGNKDGGPTSDPFPVDGNLELSGNNTLSGDIAVCGGTTLTLSGDNSGAAGTVVLINGYLQAGTANLPAGNVNFASTGNEPAIWVASGSLSLDLGSANDVFLSGNGGFAATDSALTVTLNSGAAIDWSAATGFNNKTLQLGSPSSTAPVEIPNDINIAGANRYIFLFDNPGSNDDVSILSGNIVRDGSNNRNLTVNGSGTLVLSGTNEFGAGTLWIGNGGASSVVRATEGVGLPTTAKLNFNNGVFETSGSFTRNIGTGTNEVNWANNGGFSANGGALTVNLEGGATLAWNNPATGFNNKGTLYLGSATADNVVTFQNNIELRGDRTVVVSDNPDTSNDYAVMTGIISNGDGTRKLTKNGSGTLVLSGDNSYTGITTISDGTLIINGDQTSANGLVDVKSGAALGGSGTVGGDVDIQANGGLTFDLSTPAGSHTPLTVNGGGGLEFKGASVLTITSSGGAAIGTYTLVTASGNINGSVPTTVNLPAGWTNDAPAIVDGTNLVINITSVGGGGPVTPTPATLTNSVSGSTLTFTWPAGEGWVLKNQTNTLSTGLNPDTNAWFPVPGGIDGSNSIAIDPNQPTVFYRLFWP